MLKEQMTLPRGFIIRDPSGTRYVIEGILGKGGSSAVYRVRERGGSGQVLALKEVIDPDRRQREHFIFEWEVLKRLDHPALPKVYGVFEHQKLSRVYILMSYIKGFDLERVRSWQPEKRFSVPIVLAFMSPVVAAVSYLHHQEPPVVHRDVKPSNILVPPDGDEAVLVDFSIAKEYIPNDTTTAVRHGSPGYAAPEQYGTGTTPLTDIYGLGATLYTLLTGNIPTDALTRLTEGKTDPLRSIKEVLPTISVEISAVVTRAMSLNREERFVNVEQFWQAFCDAAAEKQATAAEVTQLSAEESHNIQARLFEDITIIPTQQKDDIPVVGRRNDYLKSYHSIRNLWHMLINKLFFDGHQKKELAELHMIKNIPKDFVISYANSEEKDFSWAQWIKWQLDIAGYSTLLPPWGVQQNADISLEIHKDLKRAKRVIVILSPNYLEILGSQLTSRYIFQRSNTDEINLILPIYTQVCRPELKDLLESIQYLNLVNLEESNARARLLAAVSNSDTALKTPSYFPGREEDKNILYTSSLKMDTSPLLRTSKKKNLKVFFSYSNQDASMRDELEKHLITLKRRGLISSWDRGEIEAGHEWEQETEQHLQQADIIFLLISPDFLASDYCYETEMLQAIQRHERGEACIIPILLRPSDWESTPFSKLQMLPRGDIPIVLWTNKDTAFLNVAREIQKVVTKLSYHA